MVRDQKGHGLAYLHPSALSKTWDLRSAPPLISPEVSYPQYLPGILTGVPTSAHPWCNTWAGELLSVSAWLQVSLLSGFSKKQVARAGQSTITSTLSTSSHDHSQTVKYLYSILPNLSMPHCCHILFCAAWLQQRAHWAGPSYSSWFLNPELSPNGVTGSWCSDWPLLPVHAEPLQPEGHSCPHGGIVCV